jgi:hypothetical protein
MPTAFAPHQVQGPEFVHPDDVEESISSPVFIELDTEPEKEISMAARSIKEAAEKPAASVKVKVVAPHRVLHEGKPYVGGDVLEVPNDKEHDIWLKARWVELVKEK